MSKENPTVLEAVEAALPVMRWWLEAHTDEQTTPRTYTAFNEEWYIVVTDFPIMGGNGARYAMATAVYFTTHGVPMVLNLSPRLAQKAAEGARRRHSVRVGRRSPS